MRDNFDDNEKEKKWKKRTTKEKKTSMTALVIMNKNS